MISENLQGIHARITSAALAAGRDPAGVTLVAVSKGQPAAALREAYQAGQRDFGESYVQEWQEKAEQLNDLTDIRWHFLGHLQRNKFKHVLGRVHLLHSLDDMLGLDEMARQAWQGKLKQDVLLQVNLADEQSKRGCGAADAELFVEVLQKSPGLRLKGLMLLPPYDADVELVRPWFKQLAQLASDLDKHFGSHPSLPAPGHWLLSMGMSGDFEVAIAEGATHVRIGTALFGERT
jgi:pyridoxal phosphate enzyme (YggS family)